jgi:hypothetical protein
MGLHLERHGEELRLWNPATKQWLPTAAEVKVEMEAEIERLRRENESLRKKTRPR